MSLINVNQDLLLGLVNALAKVAPYRSPKDDEELAQLEQWIRVAGQVSELCEPVSHIAGFDAALTTWRELASSYRYEVRDYRALRDG